MSKGMRFLPPEGLKEHHMALTSGHSCVVYLVSPEDKKKGTVIPEMFRRQAIADGCEVVGMESAKEEKNDSKGDKLALILAAIAEVAKREDPEETEGDGRPKLDAVSKQVGFKVTKTQFEEAWPQFVDSLGVDDKDDE